MLRRVPGRFAALLASTLLFIQPAIVAAGPPAPPGQAPFDEIRLPNHGLVRGDVTELVPGRYVVITKRSGELRRFEWSEIESIVLADGTVLGKDTTVAPMPEPMPEPEPIPEPTIDPQPEPEPEPEPEPFDVDSLEPEPKPEPAVATEASKATPRVIITPNREGPALSLRRVTDRSEGEVGSKLPSDVKSEPVCEGACGVLVDRPTDEFFITADAKPIARGFQLGTSDSSYEIKVRRKSAVKLWTGVAMIPAAIIVGVGIGIIPLLHNVPQERIAGYAAGGALIGLAGIGGGVTLILFSFDKVKVLPGRGE